MQTVATAFERSLEEIQWGMRGTGRGSGVAGGSPA